MGDGFRGLGVQGFRDYQGAASTTPPKKAGSEAPQV